MGEQISLYRENFPEN
ncbi:TPA: hypothetical protein ACYSC8_005379 [Citrobacter freundii]